MPKGVSARLSRVLDPGAGFFDRAVYIADGAQAVTAFVRSSGRKFGPCGAKVIERALHMGLIGDSLPGDEAECG